LAEATTPNKVAPDYVAACAYVRGMLEGADRSRQELRKPPLTAEERIRFVRQLVEEAVGKRQAQRTAKQSRK
jgi:hypothetical protein